MEVGDLSDPEEDEPSPVVQQLEDPQDDSPSSSNEGDAVSSDDSDEDEDDEDGNEMDAEMEEGDSHMTPVIQLDDGESGPALAMNGDDAASDSRVPSPSIAPPSPPTLSGVLSQSAGIATAQSPEALAYLAALEARRARFPPPTRIPSSYSIDSLVSFPLACQVNAIALSPCCSNLYTGGSDGFVRRYAFSPTVNGNAIPGPSNYMMKQNANLEKAARPPVLVGYWENEEPGPWMKNIKDPSPGNGALAEVDVNVRWGSKAITLTGASPVNSLAIQSEELWGLSGTTRGTINLFTIRHDEGQIRHVFNASGPTSSTKGHRPDSTVSVLTLGRNESSILSGGWDSQILEWDLNSGSLSRDFVGHDGQVSTIAYRPLTPPLSSPEPFKSTDDDDDAAMEDAFPSKSDEALPPVPPLSTTTSSQPKPDAANSPASSTSSSDSVAAALVVQPSVTPVDGQASGPTISQVADAESEIDAEGDIDADGDVDEDLDYPPPPANGNSTSNTNGSSTIPSQSNTQSTTKPVKPLPVIEKRSRSVPYVGDSSAELPELSGDVFLSSSIDGQVMIWDRRIKSGAKGGVRRLASSPSHRLAGWCASACWSTSGQQIYVGRRSSTVEIYDLRHSSPSTPVVQSLSFPASSGSVSAVYALPSGKHLLSATFDNIRIWDLEAAALGLGVGRKPPARIVAGHHGGVISQFAVDPTCRFLVAASGNRGWDGSSTESVVIHEIKSVF